MKAQKEFVMTPTTAAVTSAISEFFQSEGITFAEKVFYTPEEWQDRGERYCAQSLLVVVYDGEGDVHRAMSLDGMDYKCNQRLQDALAKIGCYFEEGTHWYGGVYPI